jgi:hypothetical protein
MAASHRLRNYDERVANGRENDDMPGQTQPPGQSEDPRDNTVDLPRIDLPEATARATLDTIPAAPPGVQARAGQAAEPTADAAAVRPAAGSLADLRSRLSRLPYGHPSSPYEDAGLAKPPPPRLRQLELGLPAPERERVNGFAPAAEPAPATKRDPLAEFRNGHVPRSATGEIATGMSAPKPDGPVAADADAPEQIGTPEQNGNGRVRDDLQDPYALPATGNSRDRAVADKDSRGPENSTVRRSAGNGNGNDQQSTAQFGTDWLVAGPAAAGPATSEPAIAKPTGGEPTAPPPTRSEPTRSEPADSGPQRQGSVGAEYGELVERTLARFRAAEGRNMFGSYGERGITAAVKRVAGQLPHGGLVPDSEADSLKPADRFAAKLARLAARFPGIPADELAASIPDGVRYAFTFEPACYTEGTWLVHRKLKAQGFELEVRRNRWQSPEYKGIWTRWRDPAHDQVFEVQFHTTVSWAVILRTHDSYVRITDPRTAPAERARLRSRQVAAAAAAVPPPGCMEIAEFRLEPR